MEYPEQTAEQKAGLAIRIRSNGESLTKLVMMFGVRVQAMLEVRRRFQKQGFDRPVLDESADREINRGRPPQARKKAHFVFRRT